MKRAVVFLFSLMILIGSVGDARAWGGYGRSRGYYHYPRNYYHSYRPYYRYRPYYYPSYYYPTAYNPYFYPGFSNGVSVFYSSPGFGFRIGPWY